MTLRRTRSRLRLVVLGLCACTGPSPSVTDTTDHTDHTDEPDPYVNPNWDPDSCDFMGFEWESELADYLPYRDGDDRMAWLAMERHDVDVDILRAYWFEERGAIAGPSVHEYHAESVHAAAALATLLVQCDGACEDWYLATSGRATVTAAGYNQPRFEGVLEQLILQEGGFGLDNDEFEVFPDGRTWCIERAVMSTDLSTFPPRDR